MKCVFDCPNEATGTVRAQVVAPGALMEPDGRDVLRAMDELELPACDAHLAMAEGGSVDVDIREPEVR